MIHVLLIFVSLCLFGEESYWSGETVRAYAHNSEMQRRWAISFLAPHLKTLKGDETILDIGCGDGKISADISRFVPQGSVIGIDPSEAMIGWAKKQFHPLEYPNLQFQQGGFLKPNLDRKFDLIVAFSSLQHCSDLSAALTSVRQLLKPSGKVLILVPAMNYLPWNQARKNTLQCWSSETIPFRPRKFLSAEQYRELVEQVSLHPIRIETYPTMDPFTDRSDFLSFLLGTLLPPVSAERFIEFCNDWIDEYLRLDPSALSSDGTIYLRCGITTLELSNN